MKNLIVQHFHPQYENVGKPMPWIVKKSTDNIRRYAEQLGAEYRLLDGEPFRKGLRAQCQKLCVLNEEFDEYDNIAVFDTDMFLVNGCKENIFKEKELVIIRMFTKRELWEIFKGHFQNWPIQIIPYYLDLHILFPKNLDN